MSSLTYSWKIWSLVPPPSVMKEEYWSVEVNFKTYLWEAQHCSYRNYWQGYCGTCFLKLLCCFWHFQFSSFLLLLLLRVLLHWVTSKFRLGLVPVSGAASIQVRDRRKTFIPSFSGRYELSTCFWIYGEPWGSDAFSQPSPFSPLQ